MKIESQHLIAITSFSCCLLASNVAHALPKFGYFVKVEAANIHEEPSQESVVVGRLAATRFIQGGTTSDTHRGWIKYKSAALLNPPVEGWISVDDLAQSKDLRLVVGCWPLKEISGSDGEGVYDKIVFSKNGRASIIDNLGKKWPADTYQVGEVVFVQGKSKGEIASFNLFFRLNPDSKEVFEYGEVPAVSKMFEEKELAGCHGGPVLK